MNNSSKRLLCLGGVLAGSFLLSVPALAQRSRFFENPVLSGLWVDACVVEYGKINCSDWAQQQAANSFCQKQGYKRYTSASTRNEGPNHQTWRLTYTYENGQKKVVWERCDECGFRISQIDCEG